MTAHLDSFSLLAPAKINLTLHVTGRRPDGYHTLHSLIAFADIGDQIKIDPHNGLSFTISGLFGNQLSPGDHDSTRYSSNLAVRAAYGFFDLVGREPCAHIHLVKNLPVASGIGGGSADAAAVIWGLCRFLGKDPVHLAGLADLLISLGADVPVCFSCAPVIAQGIGEKLSSVTLAEDVPIVLVNPGLPCATPDVFAAFDLKSQSTVPQAETPDLSAPEDLFEYLEIQNNDLTAAAVSLVPEIAFVLESLKSHPACRVARMSGSGATCFGLFDTHAGAHKAAALIAEKHPDWWVRAGSINNIERY